MVISGNNLVINGTTVEAADLTNVASITSDVQTQLNLKVSKDSDTGASVIPAGTTAQRPASPLNGYMRYNTNLNSMEAYVNGAWGSAGSGKSLRSVLKLNLGTAGVSGTATSSGTIGTFNYTPLFAESTLKIRVYTDSWCAFYTNGDNYVSIDQALNLGGSDIATSIKWSRFDPPGVIETGERTILEAYVTTTSTAQMTFSVNYNVHYITGSVAWKVGYNVWNAKPIEIFIEEYK